MAGRVGVYLASVCGVQRRWKSSVPCRSKVEMGHVLP